MITRAEISEFCKKNKIKEPWFNPNDKKAEIEDEFAL